MKRTQLDLVQNYRQCWGLLLVLLSLGPSMMAQQTRETLTNESVLQMVQAHLGANLIVEEIRTSPAKFVLDYKSVIHLREGGVPGEVILAMQKKNAETSQGQIPEQEKGVGSPAHLVAQDVQALGSWSSEELQQEAIVHAGVLWRSILTHCGDSYYYDGSGLDNLTAKDTPLEFTDLGSDVLEFRKVSFYVLPPAPMTTAEEMNGQESGIEDTGSAVLMSTVFRGGDLAAGTWGQWMDGPLANVNPGAMLRPETIREVILGEVGQVTGMAGAGGAIIVHMQKRHGRWYYSLMNDFAGDLVRSEADLMASDERGAREPPIFLDSDVTMGHPANSNGAPVKPIYCAVVTGEVARFKAPKIGKDGFNFFASIPYMNREFHGDSKLFSSSFPAYMSRILPAVGLNVHEYDREVAFIVAAVRTCAATKPSDVQAEDLSLLGPYRAMICEGRGGLVSMLTGSPSWRSRGRNIVINVARSTYPRQGNGNLTISISFTSLPGELVPGRTLQAGDAMGFDPTTHMPASRSGEDYTILRAFVSP